MKARFTVFVLLSVAVTALTLSGRRMASAAVPDYGDRYVPGESAVVAGGPVRTWARVNGSGEVIWVGMTMPMEMIEYRPLRGTGPAGAAVVVSFPAVVQETTYFNHVEIHSRQRGHVTPPEYLQPGRYGAPHFDIHFYGIPVEQVWQIAGPTPGAPLAEVATELLPTGWAQPGASLAQMGRHAQMLSEYTATDPWLLTMIAGYLPDATYMHFIEPMITREFLLLRQNFERPVPMLETQGRATRYPTELVVKWEGRQRLSLHLQRLRVEGVGDRPGSRVHSADWCGRQTGG